MFKKKVAIAAVVALSAIAAQAQSTYLDIGVGTAKYTETALSMTPTVVRGVFGMNLNDNFAFEALGATGLGDGSTTYSGVGVTLKINSIIGAYITPKVKVGNAEIFARAGYARSTGSVTLTGSRGSLTLNADGSSPSFGGGVKFNLGNGSSVTADYMSYYSKDGIDINGVTVSYGMNF
jgi:hypothetical protein